MERTFGLTKISGWTKNIVAWGVSDSCIRGRLKLHISQDGIRMVVADLGSRAQCNHWLSLASIIFVSWVDVKSDGKDIFLSKGLRIYYLRIYFSLPSFQFWYLLTLSTTLLFLVLHLTYGAQKKMLTSRVEEWLSCQIIFILFVSIDFD